MKEFEERLGENTKKKRNIKIKYEKRKKRRKNNVVRT